MSSINQYPIRRLLENSFFAVKHRQNEKLTKNRKYALSNDTNRIVKLIMLALYIKLLTPLTSF